MRTVLQILSVVFLVVGALATLLGGVALLYAKLAPAEPPPSLNEGPGLAGLLGFSATIFGVFSILIALAAFAGVQSLSKRDPNFARNHKRLW
jgi:hypothetical protein